MGGEFGRVHVRDERAALRLAGAVDRATRGDAEEEQLRRLGLAVTKYWVCKRAPAHAAEALECLGGNGYV
ncbi:DNA alkylation response protein, partial [Streptomyces massasporeus]